MNINVYVFACLCLHVLVRAVQFVWEEIKGANVFSFLNMVVGANEWAPIRILMMMMMMMTMMMMI